MRKSAVAWLIAVLSLFICLGNAVAQEEIPNPANTEAVSKESVDIKLDLVPEATLFELHREDRDMFVYVPESEVGIAIGRPNSPWKRTGLGFVVNKVQFQGQLPIPRLYNISVDSHVVVTPPELEIVLAKWGGSWILEDRNYFFADPVTLDPKVGGKCEHGVPLFRAYNRSKNGGPNHWFTTDYAKFLKFGPEWGIAEGAVMCVAKPGPEGGTPANPAASVTLNDDNHQVQLNLDKDGKYFGWADEKGTYAVAPASIEKVCAFSNRTGWLENGRACAAPGPTHAVTIPKTCNNDQGNWAAKLKDGRWLWSELSSERAWVRKGLPSKVEGGLVVYGANGYQPAVVSAVAPGGVRIDFGSNCLMGFSKPLEPQDLLFVWNSDKAGPGGTPGWGLRSFGGSEKLAYLDWDDKQKSYFVQFTGLAQSDQGNITVYKRVPGSGSVVLWDAGPDGFGYAWFAIPPKGEKNPVWQAGTGISWNQDKFLISYTIPK